MRPLILKLLLQYWIVWRILFDLSEYGSFFYKNLACWTPHSRNKSVGT